MNLNNETSSVNTAFDDDETFSWENDTSLEDAKEVVERFHRSRYYYDRLDVILIATLYLVVVIVGLFGNVVLLFWIHKERKRPRRRKVFDKLVVSLCVSDLFVILTCCPFSVYSKVTSLWHLGSFLCTFIHYLQGVSVTSNILSMTALSVSRFLFVKQGFESHQGVLKKVTYILLCGVWLVSILISVPLIHIRKLESMTIMDRTFDFCLEVWDSKTYQRTYSVIYFFLIYFLPCCILVFCHISVTITLSEMRKTRLRNLFNRNESRKRAFRIRADESSLSTNDKICEELSDSKAVTLLNEDRNADQRRITKNQRKLSRFLMGTTICFIFCWFPYNLASFILDLTDLEPVVIILPFTLLLGHAYSSIDPIVYWYLVKGNKVKKHDCVYMRSAMFNVSQRSWNSRSVGQKKASPQTASDFKIDGSSFFSSNTKFRF